jgi:hypothetical protein
MTMRIDASETSPNSAGVSRRARTVMTAKLIS